MSSKLGDAFQYPTDGDDVARRFLIGGGTPIVFLLLGGLLTFFSVDAPLWTVVPILVITFIPVLLWTGYAIRVARRIYAGQNTPPSLDASGALLKDGAVGFLIYLPYLIPPVLVSIVLMPGTGIGPTLISDGTGPAGPAGGVPALEGIFLLTLLLLFVTILIYYLYPISLCIYAETDSPMSAFSPGRLQTVALTTDYAVPWVALAALHVFIQILLNVLIAIFIGIFLLPFLPLVYFYLITVGAYAFAHAYDDAVGVSDSGDGVTTGAVGGSPSTTGTLEDD